MGFRDFDDCLRKAEPAEPIFVLLARDPIAADVVRYWAREAAKAGHQPAKIGQALIWANEMERWPNKQPGGLGSAEPCEASWGDQLCVLPKGHAAAHSTAKNFVWRSADAVSR